jgi:hypothetical protein
MPRTDDIFRLPPNLPVPTDDGLARHLPGMRVAKASLLSTGGEQIDLSELTGRTVVYCYPRTGGQLIQLWTADVLASHGIGYHRAE